MIAPHQRSPPQHPLPPQRRPRGRTPSAPTGRWSTPPAHRRDRRGRSPVENLFATNSLCPSRASLLTGTYSHVNGVSTLDTFIDASQPTFVSALRNAGYRTGFVGKWHMGDGETNGVGHDPHGFDYWDALIDQGEYHDPRFLRGHPRLDPDRPFGAAADALSPGRGRRDGPPAAAVAGALARHRRARPRRAHPPPPRRPHLADDRHRRRPRRRGRRDAAWRHRSLCPRAGSRS